MVGVVTRRPGLVVDRNGAFLRVTPADDPRTALVVDREVRETRRLRVRVGAFRLLVPLADGVELRPEEAFEASAVAHARQYRPDAKRTVGAADPGGTVVSTPSGTCRGFTSAAAPSVFIPSGTNRRTSPTENTRRRNTMTDLREHAVDIHEQFSDSLDVSVDEIETRLETLVSEYRVPIDEAERSIVSSYLDEAGMDRDDLSGGGGESATVADIDTPEQWLDLTVKVVDLWEPGADSIAQVGLLGDETGTVKFTKWAKSDLPELDEGAVYRLEGVVTDEYQERFSVKLNSATTIEELDAEIEVGDDSTEVEGALVDIQSGSGLIKRCPDDDCTRVLQNGRCSEHGDVEGEFDLRIKGVLDDGEGIHETIFDQESTEELTGITLDEAQQMAMDALDTEVVVEEMRETVLGRYYRVAGPTLGRYVLANDIERLGAPTDAERVLIKARSI